MNIQLTTAQAIVRFLKNQYAERDRKQARFFEGCLGIFGHGNVAGIGQALEQDPGLPYYLFRNEQAMVHTAAAFAKMSNRSRTLVCPSLSRRSKPRSTASATARHCGRVKQTVALMLIPSRFFDGRNPRSRSRDLYDHVRRKPAELDCLLQDGGCVAKQPRVGLNG